MPVLRGLSLVFGPILLCLAFFALARLATDKNPDGPPCSRGSIAAVMTRCEPTSRAVATEDVMTFQRPGSISRTTSLD